MATISPEISAAIVQGSFFALGALISAGVVVLNDHLRRSHEQTIEDHRVRRQAEEKKLDMAVQLAIADNEVLNQIAKFNAEKGRNVPVPPLALHVYFHKQCLDQVEAGAMDSRKYEDLLYATHEIADAVKRFHQSHSDA